MWRQEEADDVAKNAEASGRQLVAQLEELCKLADEAEGKVRAEAAPEKPVKKKGILGRGGTTQKKDAVRCILLNFSLQRWIISLSSLAVCMT